jgi:hypothetical protein
MSNLTGNEYRSFYNFLNRLIDKFGFKSIPTHLEQHYVYKMAPWQTKHFFDIDIAEEEKTIEDIYIYGWVVEFRLIDKKDNWRNYFNYKVYLSKEVALEAINQMKMWQHYEYRVKPLYDFKNNGFRTYIINKIIKEE